MSDTKALKVFRGLTVKDADKGEVEADVCTLGVVDKDGDIVRAGSLGGTASVIMSEWGHDAMYGNRPAGKGTLVESNGRLRFKGRVFLNTTGGRETFEVLKEMGEDQEWSFGFRVTGWEAPSETEKAAGAWRVITKMDAFEVSPVLVGAGVNTGTTRLKSAPQADGNRDESVADAVRYLKAAIARHERHMNGTEATDDASQQLMMDEMRAALSALTGTTDEMPAMDSGKSSARIAAIAKEVTDRMAAEQKAAADAAAEMARLEAEALAAAEVKAQQEAQAAVSDAAAREFATFQRTLRRVA